MKKIIMSVAAFALTAGLFTANAQEERQSANPGKMDEKMAEMMVKELSLSDDLKDQFILTYQEYRKELRECDPRVKEMANMDPAEARKARKEQKNLSDEQLEAKILESFNTERAQVAVKEKYFAVFKGFLNAKQLDKVFNFNPMAQRQGDGGMGQGGPGMGGPGMGGPGMGGGMGGPRF